jgi:hypothetical protein
MDTRYVHQRHHHHGQGCDGKTRHWTEISIDAGELLVMLGCASGARLISVRIDRSGTVVLTADEHLEVPPCPLALRGG